MKKETMWVLGAAAVLGGMGGAGCMGARAQEAETESPREIQMTVYKDDFALIHESRPEALQAGRNRLRLDNVSKTLDPNTVIFDWGEAANAPDVVSNTYDLGLASGGSLLKRLDGKPVDMLWPSQNGQPHDKISGILESTQDGGFVIRAGDKLYVNPKGTIVAPSDPRLVATPQLSAEVDSPTRQDAKLEFAYQTRGMSWSADYAGRLTPDGRAMELECWATVTNQTGVDFPDAKITLVAGSPNRAVKPRRKAMFEDKDETLAAAASPMEAPESVGELYAYQVPAPARIGQEQMNRVKMLEATRIPIERDYSVRLPTASGYEWDSGQPRRQNAQLAISFVNQVAPLPAGAVRMYEGSAFVGAASLGDTPKEEHVNLALSNVFDVTSVARTVSRKKIDKQTVRVSFEVVLSNQKKTAVDLRLVQGFYGKRKLVRESSPSRALDAGTRQWTIRVEPGQSQTLTWTADFSG